MPLIDLVNKSGNDEVILSLWLVSVSTDNCGHMIYIKNGLVSLDCNMAGVLSASIGHIAIRGTAAKIKLPIGKIRFLGAPTLKMLLTNRL